MTPNKPAAKLTLKDAVATLVQDEDVALWQESLRAASTRRIYGESLLRFSQYTSMTPGKIVELFRKDQLEGEKKLQAFIQRSKEHFTPKSINNHLVGVKSWLKHNGIKVERKIDVGNTYLTPTIEGEAPPSQEELRRIMNHAQPRGRTAMSLIGFAGVRPETAAGLRLSDLPELRIPMLRISDGPIEFAKTPTLIRVRAEISKNRRPYITFLIEEGCEYLKEYLELRQRQGETLTPQSPLIRESGKNNHNSFSRKAFSKLIKHAFEKAGFKARPYVLRSYFDTAIDNARNVPHDWQQFWMGHRGDIEAIYTVRKRLPEDQIEEMRNTFHEAVEPRLTTVITETASMEKFRAAFKEDLLLTLGFTEEEMAKMNISEMKREDLQRLIRQALLGGRETGILKTLQNGGEKTASKQKVVTVSEVEGYLGEGWRFVSALNHEKAVVELPNT